MESVDVYQLLLAWHVANVLASYKQDVVRCYLDALRKRRLNHSHKICCFNQAWRLKRSVSRKLSDDEGIITVEGSS